MRNARDIDIPSARTEAYAKSYFPSTIRAWNNLDKETKNITNLEDFKERTKPNPYNYQNISDVEPEKTRFYTQDYGWETMT